jgi:hypothetical protein
VELDDSLAVAGVAPVVPGGPVLHHRDHRLAVVEGQWWATASVTPEEGADAEPALLRFDDDVVTTAIELTGGGVHAGHVWAPFVLDGDLHVLGVGASLCVLRVDRDKDTLELVAERDASPEWTAAASLSPGVACGGGVLFVVSDGAGGHRLVRTDGLGRTLGRSDPFAGLGHASETCTGAAIVGGRLLLSFCSDGTLAHLAVLSVGDALALVKGYSPAAV